MFGRTNLSMKLHTLGRTAYTGGERYAWHKHSHAFILLLPLGLSSYEMTRHKNPFRLIKNIGLTGKCILTQNVCFIFCKSFFRNIFLSDKYCSRDNAVSIVTLLRSERPRIRGPFLGKGKRFSLPQWSRPCLGSIQPPLVSPGFQLPRHEADHSSTWTMNASSESHLHMSPRHVA
jgi:hypothetical protein